MAIKPFNSVAGFSVGEIPANVVLANGDIITGNIQANANITANGNITANFFLGNGAYLTGIDATSIQNGNSNVKVYANANIAISSAGNANVAIVTGTGLIVAGTFSASGNVTAGNVSTVGNVNSGNLIATGLLSVIGNANVGNIGAYNGTFTTITGTLTTNAQPNITSVGALVDLSIIGNANIGNIGSAGVITAIGNIGAGNISTTGLITVAGNANIGNIGTGGFITATGNITGSNLFTAGNSISSNATVNLQLSGNTANFTGNVTAPNFIGNVVGNISGNIVIPGSNTGVVFNDAGNANSTLGFTFDKTSNAVVAAGNLTAGNLTTGGVLTVNGTADSLISGNLNITGKWINNVGYPVLVTDAASKQYVDNMVSSGISYHQPVNVATTTTLAIATGGTTSYVSPNGAANGIGAYISTTGTYNLIDSANVQTVGTRILVKDEANATWNGIYTYANTTAIVRSSDADEYGPDSTEQLSINDYFFTQSGTVNIGTGFVVSAPSGVIIFGTSNITFSIFSGSQVYTAGTGINIVGTVISANASQTQITAIGTLTSLSVSGNANIANIGTSGLVTATGNGTFGNVNTGGLITATGTITGANITGANFITNGLITATGNITGGNIITAGIVSATGNGTFGNISTTGSGGNITGANVVSANTFTATANITGGNIITGGIISASGNLTSLNANLGNLATANFINVSSNLNVTDTANVGNLRTDHLLYANGQPWDLQEAAGANTQIQFNDGNNNFAANANLTYDYVTSNLTVVGNVIATTFVGNVSGNISGNIIIPGANTGVVFNDDGNANTSTAFTFNKVSNVVALAGNLTLANTTIATGTTTTTAITANQTIVQFSTTGIAAMEFLVKGVDSTGSKYSVSTVTAVTNGSTVDYVTYATASLNATTGSLAVNVVGGNVALQVTPATSNSTVWTTQVRFI